MPIRKSNDTLFYLIGTIPVVWLALLLAQSLGGGLPELLRNLTSALEQPTNIIWTDKSLPAILICLAAYGMAVLLYRTNQGRTRDGEEHGSAAWATPASVNAQFAHADLIMVLENGEMKELGTHTELIQKNGIYKDMFEKQQLEASIGEQEVAIIR